MLTEEEIKVAMSDIKNRWLHSSGRKTSFEHDCFDEIIGLNRYAQLRKVVTEIQREIISMVEDLSVRPCISYLLGDVRDDCYCSTCTAKAILTKWDSLLREAGLEGK